MTETGHSRGAARRLPAIRGTSARDLSGARHVTHSEPTSTPGIVGLILTGYLDTEIRSRTIDVSGDRYRWSFGPGIERVEPLRSAPAAARVAIAELPEGPDYRISMGWVDAERRHHLAPGKASLAAYVTGREPTASADLLTGAAAGLGSALRALGSVDPTCVSTMPPPSGPTRLAHWLCTGDGPWAAKEMHDRLTALLGPSRVDEIIGWVADMPADRVVHGRAGLTAMVVPDGPVDGAPAALLTGDELAPGPRDFDLAWVLGELLIAEHLTNYVEPAEMIRQRRLITECRDAFLQAYGPAADMITTGRTTTLRVLLELHDSAAYADRMLSDLAKQAPELVDSAR